MRAQTHGYGSAWNGERSLPAQRYSYQLTYGPTPAGLSVCHRCDVPLCVRPEHLFLGSQTVNGRDAAAKGRLRHGASHWTASRVTPNRGEAHGSAKLTDAAVRTIRELRDSGLDAKEIARRYGVHPGTVHQIVSRRAWKHVT